MAHPVMRQVHDKFNTQNINVKDISSAGNVDISLMNLMRQNNDKFNTQNINIKDINSAANVNISLQELNFFSAAGNFFNNAGKTIDNSFKKAGAGIKQEDMKIGQAFANVGKGLQADMQKFAKGANTAEKHFLYDANVAAKKVGPDFKIAEKDLEWAAGEVWKGIKWCYNTAPCKAAVEKYGAEAVETALEAAVLQQIMVVMI